MNFLLNVLWAIVGGGFVTALQYALAGIVCCLTVVGIPFGMQCFKLAGVALFPFGKDFQRPSTGALSGIFNLLWIIFAGFWIFLSHIAMVIPLAVSIIGLPFAWQHLKLAMVAFAPFNLRITTTHS